jgi:Domain of unknown function (DUF1929)/Carbohydrate binding module (family 6)
MKFTALPKQRTKPRDKKLHPIKNFIVAMALQRKPMTINTRTITSSLAALILPVLLMACPGPQVDPTLCNGNSKTTEVSITGATIQAEDYSSATTGVERRQLSGGPCSLRSTSNGDSGEYALKIEQANDFDVTFNLNANAGAKLRLELDGNPVDNTDLTATATGSVFKDFTLPVLTLPAGEHKLRVVVADLTGSSAVMIDSFKLSKPTTNVPYSGNAPLVPSAPGKLVLEAEQFDRGGEGLAYQETTPGNSGAGTRISNVDIDVQGNDQFVTDTQAGESLKYSFSVPATLNKKNFKITVRYAAALGGGKFSLGLGGRKLIDKATVVASGSNTSWREEFVIVPIAPGAYEFVLFFDSLAAGATSVMNVDRLEISVDSDVMNNDPPLPPDGVIGQTSSLSQWPLMPIHAALMPNGKVYVWGGGNNYNGGSNTVVLDPSQGDAGSLSSTLRSQTTLFCAGFSHLPDGRLLIAGGHWDNFQGVPDTNIFDYNNQTISATTNMHAKTLPTPVGNPKGDKTFDPTLYYEDPKHTGRWYPSTTALPNGEILVSEGYSSIQSLINNLPEVWETNTGGGWRALDTAKVTDANALSYYPFMYPRPTSDGKGEVVRIGPESTLYAFKTGGTGEVRKLNKRPDNITRDYGSAAMFAPGKILLIGGNGGDGAGIAPLDTGVVVDINSDTPSFKATPNMDFGRRHAQTTVLPTGDVLVTSGSSGEGHNAAPYVFPIELYNVKTNSFKTLNNIAVGRGYHSIALLLPDGRILIGGGGNCGGCQTNGEQNNIEYYKPPYLFKSNGSGGQTEVTARPEITTVTNTLGTAIDLNTSIGYGENLKITANLVATSKPIARVTMIKLGAVTHGRNFDQNFNELTFITDGTSLTVTVPSDSERAYATPGHYMIFVIDTDGVPSVAKIIKLQ